ncbi:MAG: hypothetical protein U0670_21820 [Anaerolineae bacterium]
MPRFKVFHPDHEVMGHVVIDMRNAIGSEDIFPIFQKHGLGDVDPKAWYPMQSMLDALREIDESGGSMFDFVSVGMNAAANLKMPPELASLSMVQIAPMVPAIYRMNVRGTDLGVAACDVVNQNHIKISYSIPYPDDYLYGLVYGVAKRFIPAGKTFTVYYDPTIPRCDEGGETTTIHLKWDA